MRTRTLTLAIVLVLIGGLVTFHGAVASAEADSAEPDLVIESLTVSDSSPRSGETVGLVATVRNRGGVGSSSSRLRYYRSTDSSRSPFDITVDENVVSSIGPARSVVDAVSIQAPTAVGRYYFTACVASVSGESDSTNNCSERTLIDVTNASSERAGVSTDGPKVKNTCFTLVRSGSSDRAVRGSPVLLGQFLLVSEVENLTDSVLEDVYVEYEVSSPVRGNSASQKSEKRDLRPGAAPVIGPKKGYVVPFPNERWVGKCTVKRERGAWRFWRDEVLGSESVSFTFGTYPPPHFQPIESLGKLESCWPGHGESYEVGTRVSVGVDPLANARDSVEYHVHYTVRIYKDGKQVWSGNKQDNLFIDLAQSMGSFTPSSAGEYTADCRMYFEYRYDYDPIKSFLGSTMPCMKSLGLAAVCTVLVINVDAALSIYDYRRLVWITSNTFQVTPTGEVLSNPPDLVVDPPSVSDSSRDTGETFTLSATVRNSGDSASSTTKLYYYRSTDATITTDDAEVGTSSLVDILDVQEESRESTIVTVTGPPGIYYYGACVKDLVEESNTNNNCSVGRRITVTQPVQTSPDLAVESPSASDSELVTGVSFRLRATVRNSGDGSSPSTTLRYYRSTDSTITTGDTQIADDTVQALDPTETDDESERLTARDAGSYYYGACVVPVSDESNTQNNCSSGVRVTVTLVNPDLSVDSPSVSDANLETGESFTLSVTVRNQGDGASAATTLRYYRSTDSTISAGDTEVGTDSVSALDPGDDDEESASLTAPSTAGEYYYGACVDAVPVESNRSNNCSDAEVVYVSGSPDLTAMAFSGDLTALSPGETFNLTVWVANDGTQVSPTTTIRFYRSSDSTISSADMEFFMYSVRSLEPGRRQGYQTNTNAPSTPGTYYYGACLDAVADESNTQNNCSAALTATVSEGDDGPVTPGNPDLVVSLSVSDAAPETGATFSLSATVNNQGDGTSAATTLRHYRSTDSIISTDDTELGSGVVAGIGPSEAAGATIQRTAPAIAGTYYYGACVDAVPGESNTQNNCSSAVTVTVSEGDDGPVTPGNPDLVVDSPVLGVPDPPGSLATGGSFRLLTTVRNQGNGTSAATTLRYYRSADSTISTADTEEGTANVSILDASGTEGQTIDLTAPATAGTYYYGACVDAVADESNTQNNCSGAVAATVVEPTETEVDLSVVSSVSRSEVGPGRRFNLNVTTRITGVDEVLYTYVSYHRSGDSSISDSDTEVGSDTVALYPPTYSLRTGIILYAPDDVGVYYYGACTGSHPDETNTENNCSAGVAVTVTESIQSNYDLEISGSPTVTDINPAPEGSFTLSATVRNAGNAATPATTSRYYRSSDSTITSGDTQVGTNPVNRLFPGQTVLGAIDLTAPSVAGTYYYGACVDSVPRESDTTNNCSLGRAGDRDRVYQP